MNKNKSITIFALICIGLLFFDLGNIDALRQGTEGFYLLITQEMFEAKSFLTPLIYGAPHWSKPPLQFWLPQPLYWLSGGNYLQMGRLSILLFSLIATFLASQWYEKELKRNWYECFAMLIIPIYFIKYSRIFMMEMTLTYLSTLGSLYFYSYINHQTKKNLFIASLFTGLSVLIKGPVSLVMIFPGAFLYGFYKEKRILPFISFAILSVLIGSLWFIASYAKYGYSFIEYFFIRENLGKFTARNYPITSVIQGLIIFTLPVSLLLFPIIKDRKSLNFKKDHLLYFAVNFCFFYFLWFLPKQKSHHYAVPAIPFFILAVTSLFYDLRDHYRELGYRILLGIGNFLTGLGIILLAILYYFRESLTFSENGQYLTGAMCIIPLYFYLKKFRDKRIKYLRFILPLILFWQFILPMGILPLIPGKVAQIVKDHNKSQVFTSYRKPFFVEEGLQHSVEFVPNKDFQNFQIAKGDLIVTELVILEKLEGYKVLANWKIWRKGSNGRKVLNALKSYDLEQLQEYYVLAEKL